MYINPMNYNLLDSFLISEREKEENFEMQIGEKLNFFKKDFETVSNPEHWKDSGNSMGWRWFKQNKNNKSGFSTDGSIDLNTDYSLNSYNFRSDEFVKNPYAIFAGCSHTFGVGLPKNETWAAKISESLEIPNINLGMPGRSTMSAVTNIFKYIEMFGNPQYIICLFPDFLRYKMWINSKVLKDSYSSIKNAGVAHLHAHGGSFSSMPKYLEKPFHIEDIMTQDTVYWLSLEYIYMLHVYCKNNNIKFLWSCTETSTEKTILKTKENMSENTFTYLDGYVKLDLERWNENIDQFSICHLDLKDKNENIFLQANDKDLWPDGISRPHWGTHIHAHIAEDFKKHM